MKTPPAASIRLGVSLAYRWTVVTIAMLLVATCAMLYWASGLFSIKIALVWAVSGLAVLWALWDAWRARPGALHYADGEWVLAQGEGESLGTLAVALDLPHYILVRFTPSGDALAALPPTHITAQWLHLERRHGHDWLALRRALYAGEPNAIAAAQPVHHPA